MTVETVTLIELLIIVPPLVDYDSDADRKSGKPDFENRRLISPIDPLTVAGVLKSRGVQVGLLDMGIFTDSSLRIKKVKAALRAGKPRYVALVQSMLTFATAQDWDGDAIFDLAREELPGVTTILTGSYATNYPGRAIKNGKCDYSLKGEVELSLPNLIKLLREGREDFSSIPGLSYKIANELIDDPRHPNTDITILPPPAYQILDEEHTQGYVTTVERGKIRFPERSQRYRDIMTSKSCTLRCSFCSVAHFRGNKNKYRRKPTEKVITEIEQALDQGIEEIHFFDDLFANEKKQIIDLCDALSRHNLKFHWFVAQGLNLWFLDFETLDAMASVGMYRLIAPFESGCDRVLHEVVGKVHSSVDQHHNVTQWARKLDLELIGMFVVGMPGEQRHEILDTVMFAENHPEIDYSVFSIATPMIGTRMTKKLVKHGTMTDIDAVHKVIKRTVALFNTEEFSEVEMGIIRAFEWDRLNFSSAKKRRKYCSMVGITQDELAQMRNHSISVFKQYFPDYDGPKSFKDLVSHGKEAYNMAPVIPN